MSIYLYLPFFPYTESSRVYTLIHGLLGYLIYPEGHFMAICRDLSYFLKVLWYSIVCTHHHLFNQFSIVGYLICYQIFATSVTVVMNNLVHV